VINTNALKAEIVRNGMTQEEFAKKLGMHPKTFYLKMKKGKFNSDEMSEMIKLLKITNQAEIFFNELKM